MKRQTLLGLLALLALAGALAAFAASPTPNPAPARPDTLRVHLGPPEGGTDAFVALPTRTTPGPALIVVHEWWGLNGNIREVARRFARQGYVTIVPDLYHGKVASDPENAHILVRGLDEDVALSDLDNAVVWLASYPQTTKQRIGIVGFCMGGRISQLFALRSASLSAAVMFYGSPELKPERLAALKAPLQGHFGGADQGIEVARVDELRNQLKALGKTADIYVYAGAGHAFMNEDGHSYQPDAARLAWARVLSFFQKYLKE